MNLLVSACLLGQNCKYSGGNNLDENILTLIEGHDVYAVCPEQLGGLATPRPCAERCGDRVMNTAGEDVTEAYCKGAKRTVEMAVQKQIDAAILQPRSPSCGCGIIYDGTFSGCLIAGDGITAKALKRNGFPVFSGNEPEIISKFLAAHDKFK